MKRSTLSLLTMIVAVLALSMWAAAGVPQLMNYQGRLTNSSGEALDTTVSITFTIYDDSTGGNPIWTETHSAVDVNSGTFSATLGYGWPMPQDSSDWFVSLGIKVGGDPEIQPRTRLVSVPHAFHAASVDFFSPGPANVESGLHTFVAGDSNTVTGDYSSIIGGVGNTVDVIHTADTVITEDGTFAKDAGGSRMGTGGVGSGFGNITTGAAAGIFWGTNNTANGAWSFIGGGTRSTATGHFSTISGGHSNRVGTGSTPTFRDGRLSAIGGGYRNTIAGDCSDLSVIGGGHGSRIEAGYSTIAGGGRTSFYDANTGNTVYDIFGSIGGGGNNKAGTDYGGCTDAPFTTISGGKSNAASGPYSAIGGGQSNTATSAWTTVAGGWNNQAGGELSTVGGGLGNYATGDTSFIGGGYENNASGDYSTIAGGFGHQAYGFNATIGGGWTNQAADNATIAGGTENVASGYGSTIGGGQYNIADGGVATVGGGTGNTATGDTSVVSGGTGNVTLGECSMVPGGSLNRAVGHNSLAAGRQAEALDDGCFVWADRSAGVFNSTLPNQFLVRADGGVGVNVNDPTEDIDVAGTARLRGIAPPPGAVYNVVVGQSDDVLYYQTGTGTADSDWDHTTNPPDMFSMPSGNVGIGISVPVAKLHVNDVLTTNGQEALKVDFQTPTYGLGTQGIEVTGSQLLTNGTQAGVTATTSVNASSQVGSAEGRLARVSSWGAYGVMIGVEGLADLSGLDNGGGTSWGVGGRFRASSTSIINITDPSGIYYVGGVYGEVGDQIDADPGVTAVVAGVIGVDNNATGTATSYAGYFDGKVNITDVLHLKPGPPPIGTPSAGDMYIDSGDSNRLKVWDGSTWQPCWP